MIGAAVEIAENDVDLRGEGDASTEVGQEVDVVSRGFAAPEGYVVVSEGGVAVGAPEPEGVYTGLDGNVLGGAIDGLGLEAKSGQGVALGCEGGALGVAEEAEVVYLEGKPADVAQRKGSVSGEELDGVDGGGG